MKNTRILLTTTKIVAAFFLIAHLSAIQTRHSLLLTFSATVVDASDLSGGVTNNELFRAIGNGDASAVRDSLVRGGGADVRDASGNTPLVSAILAGGKPEIVRLLLDKGVDVNAGGRGG